MSTVPRYRNRSRDSVSKLISVMESGTHPGPWSHYSDIQLFDSTGLETCSDWNNRRDPLYHVGSEIDSGYINGQSFDLTGRITTPQITMLPDEGITAYTERHGNFFGDGFRLRGACALQYSFLNDIPAKVLQFADGSFWNPLPDDNGYINQYYPRARHDLRPDLPAFHLLREAVELKDIPGQITELKEAVHHFINGGGIPSIRASSKSHLAIQFGWLPLISSIRQFLALYQTVNARIEQLLRDDGKNVTRRRTYVDPSKSRLSIVRSFGQSDNLFGMPLAYPPINPPFMDTNFSVTTSVTATQRIWAVGTYMYNLPKGPHDLAYINRLARRLADFRLTIGQVYDLVPWSWLVDWFSSVGDIIHSVDPGVGENGAYSQFFLMGERKTSIEVNVSFLTRLAQSGDPYLLRLTCQHELKKKVRVPTGPFDFLPDDGQFLDPRQLTILGALGISKFPRVARSI
jgi:hypothetical protein